MKRLALLALLLASVSHAQKITYDTDQSCDCDIVYIDGIETTKELQPDGTTLYGFRRQDGTIITPNQYKYVGTFKDGYCKVWMSDTLCGLIDSTGHQLVPCLYSDVSTPFNNRILVSRNNLYGYTDLHGNLVIPLQYPLAYPFSENRAAIATIIDSLFVECTYIDTLGNPLLPAVYQLTLPFLNGYAPVRRYDRWGMIDTTGKEVLTTKFESITIASQGLFFAGEENLWSLYDYTFKPLTEEVYFSPAPYVKDNRISVIRNGKYGFLDTKGREIIPCIYDQADVFTLGRARVTLGDKIGIIDTNGHTILPIQYTDLTPKGEKYLFTPDSLALIEKDGLLGYIDLQGNPVTPLIFDQAYQFSEGLASVSYQGAWGYIDTHGDLYLPLLFNAASPFRYGRAEVIFQGNIMNIDRSGKCVKGCNGIISFRDQKK